MLYLRFVCISSTIRGRKDSFLLDSSYGFSWKLFYKTIKTIKQFLDKCDINIFGCCDKVFVNASFNCDVCFFV